MNFVGKSIYWLGASMAMFVLGIMTVFGLDTSLPVIFVASAACFVIWRIEKKHDEQN